MELVLGIDLGTSYFKLGLFDHDGKLRGLGRVAVQTDSGSGSLCELPAGRFWSILKQGLDQALEQADAEAGDICAVGYSSQANSFILLDRCDQPLTPLILWPDRRIENIDPAVRQLWRRKDFLTVTGLGVEEGPGFVIAKLLWFRENSPQIWSKTKRIMTISDYFTFSLTGQAVGDAGTASLLGILDLRKLQWWPEALDLLGLSADLLSQPLRGGTLAGPVTSNGAKLLGLKADIPLAVGSLDHHVAALGAGAVARGGFSESTGTVLACLRRGDKCEKYQPKKNVCTGPDFEEGGYFQLAFDSNSASVLQWYQQTYCPESSVAELISAAERVPPDCDGLVALPHADKYDKNSDLKGFENVTPAHTPGHFARAIMQSVAQTLASLADKLSPCDRPKRIVATGGGARSDLWLKMKSDVLGVEIVAATCPEPACKGAAMLASVAINWFETLNQATNKWASISHRS